MNMTAAGHVLLGKRLNQLCQVQRSTLLHIGIFPIGVEWLNMPFRGSHVIGVRHLPVQHAVLFRLVEVQLEAQHEVLQQHCCTRLFHPGRARALHRNKLDARKSSHD